VILFLAEGVIFRGLRAKLDKNHGWYCTIHGREEGGAK